MSKKTTRWTLSAIKAELERAGRVGEIFVDGDQCREAWHPHSRWFMNGDDMDYNPEAALPLKKTLLRVERTCPFPCFSTLFRQRPDMDGKAEALLYGTGSSVLSAAAPSHRAKDIYELPPMARELKEVFLKGRRAWKIGASAKTGTLIYRGLRVPAQDMSQSTLIQHFVPVKDSMGDIAAALELFTVASEE